MTWLNRGFKIRHKFIEEKEMKTEAIRALELFKQQHLARPAVEETNEQADIVSESSEQVRKKGVNYNYPDHYKPLKDRIMSALNNGARTAEAVAKYCNEGEKLINLQLGRWVSRGLVGRKVSPTGIIRFYPEALAKEMGILETPKPINYWTKERKAKAKDKKQSSSVVDRPPQTPNPIPNKPTDTKEAQYIEFLEKRMVEWQNECRKMAKQISELESSLAKAKSEPRNVTGEVAEVMKEVMELRNTVAYLESKLFGRK